MIRPKCRDGSKAAVLTCAAMSALTTEATVIATYRKVAGCHWRAKCIAAKCGLFDHLVCRYNNCVWHVEAECLGSLEVDRQLEFGPSDNRQVSRFGTPKNATDVVAGLAKRFSKVAP